MALNASALSSLIQQAMGDLNSGDVNVDKSYEDGIKKLADAIAQSVVTHITSNAVVNVNAGIALVAGNYTGATTAIGTGTIQ